MSVADIVRQIDAETAAEIDRRRADADGRAAGVIDQARAAVAARVEKAGSRVTAVLGDYRGRAWDLRADVWLLLAARR